MSNSRQAVSKLRRRRSVASNGPFVDVARFSERIRPIAASDPPGPSIVLLNDCRDQINFGSNALVDGLIAILRRSVPNGTLFPIPSHWLVDAAQLRTFANDGIGMERPRAKYPRIADQFETLADEWMKGRGGPGADAFLTRFEGVDLVVLNGEGSLYRTNVSAIRELFLAWLCKVRLGLPTIFINGTVHLTDVAPVLPAMVRKTFSVLDAVAVREAPSHRNLRQYAPDVDAQLFPDSAFVFTPDDARETPAVRTILEQIGDRPYFCFDPGAMPMDDRTHKGSALQQMITALKRVTPHAVFVAAGPDDRYIERIARETESLFVDQLVDYREWMSIVARAQFLVSGRYHNTILAAIMGCPTIPFASSSHKVHGACEMLDDIVGTPYDGTDLRPRLGAIEEHARSYANARDALRDSLFEVCGRRRKEAFALGRLAAEALRLDAAGSPSVLRESG